MYVSDFALNEFRSYRELVVQLPPGVVVFQGRNGRGKTNLVEAVLYLSTFSSHRVNADRALVRVASAPSRGESKQADQGPAKGEGQDQDSGGKEHLPPTESQPTAAVIRARVLEGSEAERERLLELEIVRGKANRARLNRGQVQPRELLGVLRTVMFAPEDVQLLRGDPAGRRRFLDQIITQVKPSYAGLRRDFQQALRQRGATLKQLGPSADPAWADDILAPWDQAVAKMSGQIAAHRHSLIKSLRASIASHYADVSDDSKQIDIHYDLHLAAQERSEFGKKRAGELEHEEIPALRDGYFPDLTDLAASLTNRFAQMLQLRRSSEIRRSVNLVGAHLDDFSMEIAGLPVKGYASQGETWSAVLALRLAQVDLLTRDGDTPVLILDDVFSELDDRRRAALAESVKDIQQVLITAANLGDLPELQDPALFRVDLDEDGLSQIIESELAMVDENG